MGTVIIKFCPNRQQNLLQESQVSSYTMSSSQHGRQYVLAIYYSFQFGYYESDNPSIASYNVCQELVLLGNYMLASSSTMNQNSVASYTLYLLSPLTIHKHLHS
ncbi:hypothetical protein Drorol1_Dr00019066 [Drosera rotundifolia]